MDCYQVLFFFFTTLESKLLLDEQYLYAATRNTITCFEFETGIYLWTLRTGVGYPMSMKYFKVNV